MKLLKPAWVHHDEKQIFSVDIHQDCTKFATGGQGNDCGRVVIWNLKPVLSEKDEFDETIPKMLCQMDQHLACVNCVRWSQNGVYLASGSDDKLIMIWRKITGSSGVFGTGGMQKNHESWKCFHTLRGHAGDVLDLAWSPNDIYLASCSIDNTVIIWDAQAFPSMVTTLKGHTGLVKGVSWDPVGRFLASQSDDHSIKMWNTMDWTLSETITEPFEECGGTTHILRLSWSPDGQYLVSAHAMNGGVPTAQIIEREGWRCDKDFVGHRKAVTCVRFHNSVLIRPMSDGLKQRQYCCLAVGSRDRSLSVWMTALQRPLVLIHELFEDSILDLSWGPDQCLLMACSGDGTVACLQFTDEELGQRLSAEKMDALFMKRYGEMYGAGLGFGNKTIVEISDQSCKYQSESSAMQTAPLNFPLPNAALERRTASTAQRPISKQTETRTKDGKRRITPMFIPLNEEERAPAIASSSGAPTAAAAATAAAAIEGPHATTPTECAVTPRMPEALVSAGRKTTPSHRRQSMPFDPSQQAEFPRSPKTPDEHQGTTMGPKLNITATAKSEFVKTALDYRLLVQNGHLKTSHGMLAKVTASIDGEFLWEFYVGSPVVNVNLCAKYCMLCSLDGSMRLISMETGCHVFPAIALSSSAVHCAFSPDNSLVGVLTECGLLRIWNIAGATISLAAGCKELLIKHGAVVQFSVTDQGMPLIGFPNGNSYSYSTSLESWLVLATKDAIMYHGIRGTLPRDEDLVARKFPLLSMQASSQNYFVLGSGMELRKLESWQQTAKILFIDNQIKLCEALQSTDELKHWHTMQALQLSAYGSEKRLRTFLDELLSNSDTGIATFASKHELAQCVLDTLKSHGQWRRLHTEYTELLKFSRNQRIEDIFATPAPPQPRSASPSPPHPPQTVSPSPPRVPQTVSPSPPRVPQTVSPSPPRLPQTVSPSPPRLPQTVPPGTLQSGTVSLGQVTTSPPQLQNVSPSPSQGQSVSPSPGTVSPGTAHSGTESSGTPPGQVLAQTLTTSPPQTHFVSSSPSQSGTVSPGTPQSGTDSPQSPSPIFP
ncbi:GL14721 [Drosophila persimilis]|uniref:Protein HIRA n=1 Tax=Drosophila persimilis TaxID=7234 RepID=B4GVU3_DROPE|nr:protein HIRA homolog [Drosophila persimilis]EDW26788.1 GL14721 [Drosophila persimilis]